MKYVRFFYKKATEKLYDLDRDLGEKKNFIKMSKYQSLVKEMRERLDSEKDLRQKLNIFIEKDYHNNIRHKLLLRVETKLTTVRVTLT